ncbi:Acyl-transf-3 domain-containing protein [Aphelenchoides bicaudatus]|nr:Acyl-transf-3 domain-containing protein [Aphelenchoides bicaudatus]
MKGDKYQLIPDEPINETNVPSNNEFTLYSLPQPTRDGMRPEIQGLRAIAIIAVLLFHMWSNMFRIGYLGVDCFFVISGYLMIMLMSRKKELTLADTTLFYYRRIKRIVPTYIFVIVLTLIACYFLISEFEFDQIVSESTSSLFFYSNFPFIHKFNYFDNKSKYRFFLHTWSLSCELQFYLFVPLLMLILGILTNIHFLLTLLFILILSITSFYRQVTSTSNAKHMTLDGRVWQFMFGFLAHFIYQSKLLNLTTKNLKRIGDISYSVYLIHWPIFTMHRYLNPNSYEGGKEAGLFGAYLIAISILLGYLIEKGSLRILVSIKNWRHLHKLLFVLYLAATVLLALLNWHALDLVEDKQFNKEQNEKRQNDTIMLWETRNDQKLFLNNKTIALNTEISYMYPMCSDKNHRLSSKIKYLNVFEEIICHEKGNGNKTVIVIGNSHAFRPFTAIARMFRPLAREITLISVTSCFPGSEHHQSSILPESKGPECVEFKEKALEAMRQYDYRIDIIIPLFGWFDFKPFPANEAVNLENELQKFYNSLNSIAKEVVFAPTLNLFFKKHPLWDVQGKLKANKEVGMVGERIESLLRYQPIIQHAVDKVECQKCLKINWTDLWCRDGYCSAIDKRRILYFSDNHHTTLYGSLFAGEFLLNAYNNYMNKPN